MKLAFFLLWAAFAILLGYFHSPGLSFFDGSELALHIRSGGIAHAPGYPLYLLIGRTLNSIVNDPFLAQHLINQISLAGASLALVMALRVESRRNGEAFQAKAAWLTLLLFYSSYFLKLYTLLPEVFLLNLMIFSLLGLALMVWYVSPEEPRAGWSWRLMMVFVVYGLGASHHHTLALTLPAFWVLAHWKKLPLLRSLAPMVVGFGVGALPLAYLFHAVSSETHHTYFIVEDWQDFFFVFLRKAYGTFQLTRSGESSSAASPHATLLLGLARNFGYIGLVVFAPIPYLIASRIGEPKAWTRLKDFLRTRPTLTFSGISLLMFAVVFVPNASLDLSSVVNRNTLWRFITIPGFLLMYWAYFALRWSLLRWRSDFVFYGIALTIFGSNVQGWKSIVAAREDPLRWQFDRIYQRIFDGKPGTGAPSGFPEKCAFLVSSDTLSYGLQYYNETARDRCYVFTPAQFSGHFRSMREEALLAEVLGADYIDRARRLHWNESDLIQALFRSLLARGYRLFLVHPRDIQYLGGAGLGVKLFGSAMEVIDPAHSRESDLLQEWAAYLDEVEAHAAELERKPFRDAPLLDEYAELAWIQNLFGYLQFYEARKAPTSEGEALRLRTLRIKARLSRIIAEEPKDFFARSGNS